MRELKSINEIMRQQGLLQNGNQCKKKKKWSSYQSRKNYTHTLHKSGSSCTHAKIDEGDIHITIINNKGERVGTQFIEPDGKKKFSFQMPVTGNFAVVGGKIEEFAYLCEVFAIACSVYEATG